MFILPFLASNSFAATKEQSCEMWAGVAHKMAVDRDAEVPIKVWDKRIDGIHTSSGGVTEDNVKLMRAMLTNVYKTLKRATPEDIQPSTYQACMTTW
jgi:hypothetical protein